MIRITNITVTDKIGYTIESPKQYNGRIVEWDAVERWRKMFKRKDKTVLISHTKLDFSSVCMDLENLGKQIAEIGKRRKLINPKIGHGKKIYVAGKITGLPYDEVVKKFKDAQIKLEKQGFEVFNPIEISPFVEGKTWDEYMAELLPIVETCDLIYMLEDWEDSRGAKDERQRAIEKNLVIVYQ